MRKSSFNTISPSPFPSPFPSSSLPLLLSSYTAPPSSSDPNDTPLLAAPIPAPSCQFWPTDAIVRETEEEKTKKRKDYFLSPSLPCYEFPMKIETTTLPLHPYAPSSPPNNRTPGKKPPHPHHQQQTDREGRGTSLSMRFPVFTSSILFLVYSTNPLTRPSQPRYSLCSLTSIYSGTNNARAVLIPLISR